MKKRILGLLLASCVTLGAMPVNLVLAEETGQTEAAQETEVDASEVNDGTQDSGTDAEPSEKEEENDSEATGENENAETQESSDEGENLDDAELAEAEAAEETTEKAESSAVQDTAEKAEETVENAAIASARAAAAGESLFQDPHGDISDYNIYLANYFIEFGGYDYMTETYDDPCTILVRNGKEAGLDKSLATWRAATFNGSSEFEHAESEVAYYDSILFDLMYNGETQSVENTIYDDISKAANIIKVSSLQKMFETGNEVLLTLPVTDETADLIYDAAEDCDIASGVLKEISKYTDFPSKLIGYVDTGREFIEKVSEIAAVMSVADEIQDIITDLANSYTKIDALNAALENYNLMFSGFFTEETFAALMKGEETVANYAKKIAAGAWDAVLASLDGAGLMIKGGQAIGKTISNLLVSTDEIMENFYSMEAMSNFTDLLASQVQTYKSNFCSSPSEENAKKFNAAYELLYKANLINLDYAQEYQRVCHEEGYLNYIIDGAANEDYQKAMTSIDNLRKDLSMQIDFYKTYSYRYYLEEYPSALVGFEENMEVQAPGSDEDLIVLTSEIQEINEQFSDMTISDDKVINDDTTHYGNMTLDDGVWSLNGNHLDIYGDLNLSGGTFRLDGGSITVYGNVNHEDGTFYLSKGTMEVTGDYYLHTVQKDGSIIRSDGKIVMEEKEDLLIVNGDFYSYTNNGPLDWEAGRTELGGDFYFEGGSVHLSDTHTFVFTGTDNLVIEGRSPGSNLRFSNVVIENADKRKILMVGDIEISNSLKIDGESLNISPVQLYISINGWEGKPITFDGDVNVQGDTISMKGSDLTVKGQLTVEHGTFDMQGGNITVEDDLYMSGGTINMGGGTFNIGGDVHHSDGLIYLGGGSMYVPGTYYHAVPQLDGSLDYSTGELRMDNPSDLFRVQGDIITYTSMSGEMTWDGGRTEIGGNLYAYSDIQAGEGHTSVFTGNQDLKIVSDDQYDGVNFYNLEIENAADRKITLNGTIGIQSKLISDVDTMRFTLEDALLSGAGFGNQNLIFDGDLYYSDGSWSVNGKNIQVNGDVYQTGGIINLGKGNMAVTGSYYHEKGTVNPSGGTLNIAGSYYNAIVGPDSSSGDLTYGESGGLLYMTNIRSYMDVAGDFVMASNNSHSDKLTAGTIAIGGDFRQIEGDRRNFACSGTLCVLLDGDDTQDVSFESEYSKFNILQLTKDEEEYTFNPNPCWNELEKVESGFAILTEPGDCAAAAGENAVFSVKVSGEELTYQWQTCGAEDEQWKDVQAEGSSTDTITLQVTSDMDGQKYRCIIKNGEGESITTREAVLNVKYELTILEQPADFTGGDGDTAIFSVTAAGYQVSYQWQYQNADSEEWRNSSMTGNASSTLVVPVTSSRNGQKYRCVLTDGDGRIIATDSVVVRIKAENPFTDVVQGQYYYDSVLWAYENGIASGLSENEFGPDAQCTRAQVVIFLWRAKGQPKASLQELPFEDVEKGTYYYDAVAWAYENNIVSGVDGTHFGPDDPVSRGQFVTFLYRTEGKPGYTSENPFTDVAQWAYYYDAVLWAYENGIASGLSDGIFGSEEFCTRGQVVTFLYRAYN